MSAALGMPAAMLGAPVALGWAMLAGAALTGGGASLCLGPRRDLALRPAEALGLAWQLLSPAAVLATALPMVLAMALPLAWRPALHVRGQSFPADRTALLALLLMATALAWLPVMALVTAGGVLGQAALTGVPATGALAAAAVALHRASGEGRRALSRCHALPPIRPFQPGCVADVARLGAAGAVRCARLCWPAMLLPWFVSRPLEAMALTTVLALRDRLAFRPGAALPVAALLGFAALEVLSPG